jgi:hypothetical protein
MVSSSLPFETNLRSELARRNFFLALFKGANQLKNHLPRFAEPSTRRYSLNSLHLIRRHL